MTRLAAEPAVSAFHRLPVVRAAATAGVTTTIAVVVSVLLILSAVLAPFIAPYDPASPDVLASLSPPTLSHPLGTDATGRDVLSRLLYGGQATLGGAFLVVSITAVVGTTLALASAWFGGWFDALVARVTDVLFAFPGLLLAILVVAVVGPGFVAPVIALAIAYTPSVTRVMRSVAIRERNLPYIAALRLQGGSAWSINLRHVLPNVTPILLVQIAVGFGYAMVDLSAISFLGLGLQPPATDWGLVIAQGRSALIAGRPEQSLFGALVMLAAVVSFNLVGEHIAQWVEGSGR